MDDWRERPPGEWQRPLTAIQVDTLLARYAELTQDNERLREELKTARNAGWGAPTVNME